MRVLGKGSVSSFLAGVLTVAFYGLAIVLVAALCLVAVSPFVDASDADLGLPVSFDVDSQALHVGAPSLGVTHAEITRARASLRYSPGSRAMLAAPVLAVILMMVVALWVLSQLRALFRTLRDGKPFAAANATRLRRVAWVVLLAEPARALMVWSANHFVMTSFVADGLRFNARPDLNLGAIFNGLIILVIAEVFRAGTRLDEDQSLTI
jgi:hypothetical protein